MDPRHVELVAEHADVLQVGARNMQNFSLLKELSKIDKPVLLKRGPWATLKEWLMAAEYILARAETHNSRELRQIPVRIAIPCEDERGLGSSVSMHFGRARYYVLVDVEDGKISSWRVVEVPFEEHGPGDLPNFLRQHGVDVVLAYGMGPRAQGFLAQMGIKAITGVHGKVGDAVRAYLEGRLAVDKDWRDRPGFKRHEECPGRG